MFTGAALNKGSTIFSNDREYRYYLSRNINYDLFIDHQNPAIFVMLNPSTADEVKNDPTITRCLNFARQWGNSKVIILNLYAYRATDPEIMKSHPEPVGKFNNLIIDKVLKLATDVVCAWGNHADYHRVKEFIEMAQKHKVNLWCLGINKNGSPKHPLYIKSTQNLIKFNPKGTET